jgi:hypothetical protein
MATQSFRRILELLDEHGVEYIVVGGVAAVLRGAPITTFDIDTLVRLDPANAERLIAALQALDARYREHPGQIEPTVEDVLAGGHLLLMTNCGPLDVLGHIANGKRYEDMMDKAPVLFVGVLGVRVLGIEALLAEKLALGRAKDRAVAELLEAVLKREPRKES